MTTLEDISTTVFNLQNSEHLKHKFLNRHKENINMHAYVWTTDCSALYGPHLYSMLLISKTLEKKISFVTWQISMQYEYKLKNIF